MWKGDGLTKACIGFNIEINTHVSHNVQTIIIIIINIIIIIIIINRINTLSIIPHLEHECTNVRCFHGSATPKWHKVGHTTKYFQGTESVPATITFGNHARKTRNT